MQVRILSADQVRQALPMDVAIQAMKEAFGQLARGQADLPLRSQVEVAKSEGVVLFMPALLRETRDLAIKVVSVFPHNQDLGLPTINALVVAVDAGTGQPTAMLEGGSLTAIRTGAVSGAAADLLARPDSRIGAIFGSGAQARTQLEAVCTVRPLERVWVFGIDDEGVSGFIDEMRGQGPIPEDLRAAKSPAEAVADADIICTATTSKHPVFRGEDLQPGAHINAIGAFTPEMRELDAVTLQKALVTVDSLESAREEAGDLIIPIKAGRYDWEQVYAELGEVIIGTKSGREEVKQITVFKSVGVAIQDAAAARCALQGAEALGLGQVVEL